MTDVLFTHGSLARHLVDGRNVCEELQVEIWKPRSIEVVYGHIDVGRGRSVYGLTRSRFKSRREFWCI
jgi:hypothetical protein